jgi:hypothetical protein
VAGAMICRLIAIALIPEPATGTPFTPADWICRCRTC